MALASLSNPRTKISSYDLAHLKVSGTDVSTEHTTEKRFSDVQMYMAPTLFYRTGIGGEVEYEIRFGLDTDGLDGKAVYEAMKHRVYTTVYFTDLISTIQVVLGAGNKEVLVEWPAPERQGKSIGLALADAHDNPTCLRLPRHARPPPFRDDDDRGYRHASNTKTQGTQVSLPNPPPIRKQNNVCTKSQW
ncbi:hypothetical protein ARMGADRAFT_1169135 [Armillaria gallica]|uniref:Uncharacterized protein n=1 Tax=Armillaria gallica TaxID=47427 RepID=A0A2H3D6G2_ARMGA|nr:hypothetical protein ARMGADRAFT_1169135 [Armillaria gallica]